MAGAAVAIRASSLPVPGKYNNQPEIYNRQELSSKAYKLFSEGKTPVSHSVDSTIYFLSHGLLPLLTDNELPTENNQLDLKNPSTSAQISIIIAFSLTFHNIPYTGVCESNKFWNDE